MSLLRCDGIARFQIGFGRAVFLAALLACAEIARGGPPAPAAATAPEIRSNPQPAAAPDWAAAPAQKAQEVPASHPDAGAGGPPPSPSAGPSGDPGHHDPGIVRYDNGGNNVNPGTHDNPQPKHKHHEPQPQPQPPEVTPDTSTPDDHAGADSNTSIPTWNPTPGVTRRHYTMDDLIDAPDPAPDPNHHTMDELL